MSDWAPFFGDLGKNEKLSKIKPRIERPLTTYIQYVKQILRKQLTNIELFFKLKLMTI